MAFSSSIWVFIVVFGFIDISASLDEISMDCYSDTKAIIDIDAETEITFRISNTGLDCTRKFKLNGIGKIQLKFTEFSFQNWRSCSSYIIVKTNTESEKLCTINSNEFESEGEISVRLVTQQTTMNLNPYWLTTESPRGNLKIHLTPVLLGLFIISDTGEFKWDNQDTFTSPVLIYSFKSQERLSNPQLGENGARGRNFEKAKIEQDYTLEMSLMGDTYGKTISDYNNTLLMPHSYIPSCHSKASDTCGWLAGDGVSLTTSNEQKYFTVSNGQGDFMTKNYLSLEKVCLHIEYQASNIKTDGIEMSLMLLSVNEFDLLDRILLKTDMEWHIITIISQIPQGLQGTKLKLVLSLDLKPGEEVNIRKIYGCNPYRAVDRYKITNNFKQFWNFKNTKDLKEDKNCENGGKLDPSSKSCICPVGFNGDFCENGCGPNKYGPSCEDQCSSSNQMCERMVFCKQNMGCHCAPGFMGSSCSTECSDNNYGVGCSQNCGKCRRNEPCDKYTGICFLGCEPGYIPPLCKSYYVHSTVEPEISAIDFKSAIISTDIAKTNLVGIGTPVFYQIQCKDSNSDSEFKPCSSIYKISHDSKIVQTVSDLLPGHSYTARVIILTDKLMTYENDDVPSVQFTTNCTDMMLNISSVEETQDSIVIIWENYSRDDLTCPGGIFEVGITAGNEWKSEVTKKMSFTFNSLAPDTYYVLRVKYNNSFSRYYYTSVTTLPLRKKGIDYLKIEEVSSTSIELSWSSPGTSIHHFSVEYECLKVIGSKNENSCSNSKNEILVDETRAVVSGLRPASLYKFRVQKVPVNIFEMIHAYFTPEILAATYTSVPEVSPILAEIVLTNTTALISWLPPNDCDQCNGFLQGYRFIFNESHVTTEDTSILLENLAPSTEYQVKVFLVNDVGWNSSVPLVIDFITSSSVPSKVVDFSVYKRGRVMLGLRWGSPKQLSGDLQSFIISTEDMSIEQKPEKCVIWPEFYCYTLTNLKPETTYNISVRAKNNKIDEYGQPSYVTALTEESVPEAIVNLTVANITETSIEMKWKPPYYFNGILRSFLIKIDQTESLYEKDCCQYYPKTEILVENELPEYHTQISGLSAGSTYALSVMAETVWLGPSVRISVDTQPPVPKTPIPPKMFNINNQDVTLDWPQLNAVTEENGTEIVEGRLVLVIPPDDLEELPNAQVKNEHLQKCIEEDLNISWFYVAAEVYEDFENIDFLVVGTGNVTEVDGTWSKISDPILESNRSYRLVLVNFAKYCGLYNVATVTSLPFTPSTL